MNDMAGLGRRSHYRKHLTDAVLHDLPEPDESIGQRIARVVGTRGGNMFDVIVAPLSSTKNNTIEKNDVSENDSLSKSSTDPNECCAERQSTETTTISSEEQPQSSSIQQRNTQRTTTTQLAFLPTKFRKLVWIKRNDFVIVECGDEVEEEEEKVGSEDTSDATSQKKHKQNKSADANKNKGFRYVITHILYKDQVKHIKSKGLWPTDPSFVDDVTTNGGTQDDDCYNDEEEDDVDNNDGTYEDNGIVFNNDDALLDDDMMMVNTNRIATLRVEDSSSDEDSD